jgi:hypothetical protein
MVIGRGVVLLAALPVLQGAEPDVHVVADDGVVDVQLRL